MVEATEFIVTGRQVILVSEAVPGNTRFNGSQHSADKSEISEINAARSYLAKLAQRHNAPVFATIESAIDHIIMGRK
jgi:hypothetical protein